MVDRFCCWLGETAAVVVFWWRQRVRDFRDYPPSPAQQAWALALVLMWLWWGWLR